MDAAVQPLRDPGAGARFRELVAFMCEEVGITASIAKFMWDKTESGTRRLYQSAAAFQIIKNFGKNYIYKNKNGNNAISPEVLAEFRKLYDGKMVWERSDQSWRPIRPRDKRS